MFTTISLHLPLLVFLSLVSYVAAQAQQTPPPISAPDPSDGPSLSLSLSATSIATSAIQSGSGSSSSATTTSSAAFPSLTGLSECATNCFGLAIVQDDCDSFTDVNCYCSPRANATLFANALVACISQSECKNELPQVESIVQQFCAVASSSTSLSFPTSVPSTSFSNPFTSSTKTSASSTSVNSTATRPSSTSSASSTGVQGGGNNAAVGLTVARGVAVAGVVGFVGAFLGVLV